MIKTHFNVLIVDDVENNLQVLSNILDNKGIAISLAMNGKSALKTVQRKKPDLILLDISMPEMDGYEVCEKLKKDDITKDIPVIFLTALSDSASILKGFAYGAVDYITKPFNKDELLSRVFTHLELKKSRDIIEEQNKKLEAQGVAILEHSKNLEKANNSLKIKNDELEELNATKDKLFSIISHDLRGPVGNLISFTQLLSDNIDKYDKDKINRIIHNMSLIAGSTYKLLKNLLEWSSFHIGNIKFNPKKTDLHAIVEDTISYTESSASIKKILVESEILEGTFVNVDVQMIHTVFRNLLSNAIKFTHNKGKVSIYCSKINSSVEVTVSDTGIGITESNLSKFFKKDNFETTKGTNGERGTGLGLHLCKEFVEKNGGTIRIESEAGIGSKFIFTIPVILQKTKQEK